MELIGWPAPSIASSGRCGAAYFIARLSIQVLAAWDRFWGSLRSLSYTPENTVRLGAVEKTQPTLLLPPSTFLSMAAIGGVLQSLLYDRGLYNSTFRPTIVCMAFLL